MKRGTLYISLIVLIFGNVYDGLYSAATRGGSRLPARYRSLLFQSDTLWLATQNDVKDIISDSLNDVVVKSDSMALFATQYDIAKLGSDSSFVKITADTVDADYLYGNGSNITNLPTGAADSSFVKITADTVDADYLYGDGSNITNLPGNVIGSYTLHYAGAAYNTETQILSSSETLGTYYKNTWISFNDVATSKYGDADTVRAGTSGLQSGVKSTGAGIYEITVNLIGKCTANNDGFSVAVYHNGGIISPQGKIFLASGSAGGNLRFSGSISFLYKDTDPSSTTSHRFELKFARHVNSGNYYVHMCQISLLHLAL